MTEENNINFVGIIKTSGGSAWTAGKTNKEGLRFLEEGTPQISNVKGNCYVENGETIIEDVLVGRVHYATDKESLFGKNCHYSDIFSSGVVDRGTLFK